MQRQRFRHGENDHEPLDRWLVSYADYVTLMFALFVVLYSIAINKEEQYKTISDTLSQVFDKPAEDKTGVKADAVLTDNTPRSDYKEYGSSLETPTGPEIMADAKDNPINTKPQFGNPLVSLQEQVTQSLANLIEKGVAKVEADDEWMLIELNSGLLFPSGSGTPTKGADLILAEIVSVINQTKNLVRVRGYTDNETIHNEIFDSNWELSMTRSMAILRRLQALGVSSSRLAAEGYGQYSPTADNDTAQGRAANRKVVIAVSKLKSPAEPVVKMTVENLNKTDPLVSQPADSEANLPFDTNADGTIKIIRLPNGGIKITANDNGDTPKQQQQD